MNGWRVAAIGAAVVAAGCAGPQGSAPVVDRTARATPAPLTPPVVKESAPTPRVVPEDFYEVKKGDTLYSIALEHGADYRELAQWNALDDPAKIRVGQLLRVRQEEARGVTIGRMSDRSRVEARPLDALPAPVVSASAAPTPVPTPPSVAPAPAASPKEAAKEAATDFIWPLKGKVLAGFAEPRSKGIDIDGRPGDAVVAAAAGRVTYTGSGIPGLGKLVVIKHDNGFITVYAHNREILVKEQQSVRRGQKIAELGASDADRPKLHFQIRKGSAAVDPLRYLPAL
jgi:lipoprotein NlpD